MIYEAWRITYQSSEAAARAAYNAAEKMRAENAALNAEIELLRARVQELGEMARENRSRRIVELEGRIAELDSEATENARIIGASAETELALRGRIAELEEQMAAIGAGGVEPLECREAV